MSYSSAAALQEAVFQTLASDNALSGLVGNAIYDKLPAGTLPPTYVTLGPEDVRDRSDKTGGGTWHRFTVSVITEAEGFYTVKQVAAAINDALVGTNMSLSRGRLAGLYFNRARARREGTGNLRRVDLTFRARVEDIPNPQ